MNTKHQEVEYMEQTGHAGTLLAGLLVGGLVGAGTMLLLAPQAGVKTRAQVQKGALRLRDQTTDTVKHLRDQTTDTVKDTISQVKSKANEIKDEVQDRAEDLQHQGQDLIAKQLDRVSHAAEAGKKAIKSF